MTRLVTRSKMFLTTCVLGLAAIHAKAGELDKGPVRIGEPVGIVVRVDKSGRSEAFVIKDGAKVSTNDDALKVLDKVVNEENRIVANKTAASELDKSQSTASWFYWGFPRYRSYPWAYGYYYPGYSYTYYYPYYNYSYGNYNYFYYWGWR